MFWPQLDKKPLWIILFIGFVLYFPTLFNGFVWDDEELIVNNRQIQSLSNLPAFFSGSTFNSGGGENLAGLYYKPLMTTAFAAVYSLAGPNPFFFHAFQISVHLANSVLLYLVLCYLFKKFGRETKLAFLPAVIFLVHPINAEAVVYIADYQDVLFFFFGILMFYLILQAKTVRRIFYVSLLVLPALLSKETGAVFSTIVFIYLILFDREKLKPFLAGVIVSLLVYSYLRFGIANIFFNKHGLTGISTISLAERLINIPEIVFTYLKNFFWPVNLAINQQWTVKSIAFWPAAIDLSFLGVLSILSFLVFKKRREIFKLWVFFLIWFLLALGFHLQIFPLDLTVSDRWFYLPSAGLLALIFLTIDLFRFKNIIIFWIVVLLLGARTFIREFDWRDGLTLYSHDIRISKNAFDLENNLGVELFRAGKISEAKTHFEKSVELSPKWWTSWNNLGAVYEREENLLKAQEYYQKAIDNGQYYLAYENYAGILIKQKKFAEALKFLESEALVRLPDNLRLQQMLQGLYNQK